MTYKQVTNRIGESEPQGHQIGKGSHVSIAIEVEKGGVLIRSIIGKNSETVISETAGQTLGGPSEEIAATCNHLQELITHCESEAEVQDYSLPAVTKPRQSRSENIGKRKRKLLRKMQRLKDGKGVTATIGEFDFLFENASEQDSECSRTGIETNSSCPGQPEIRINHWEVSVKFLLYAGPWELFGFETPNWAAWHGLKQEGKDEAVRQQSKGLQHEDTTCNLEPCESTQFAWQANDFLGCFLGPHVGETLYNRKTRLINQLALSQNIHAASLLCKTFGPRSSRKETSSSAADDTELSSDQTSGSTADQCKDEAAGRHIDEAIETEHAEVLRVSPRALLKGYLFYEYDLWCQLYWRGQGMNHSLETLNSRRRNSGGNLSHEASVNPEHWTGWWTRAQNFTDFARLAVHEHSKWYIVPKLEWLSPVVISEEDEGRARQVLSLDDFLIMAGKVAEEAERTNISRKRRFMVAEVLWETLNADQCAVDPGVSSAQVSDEALQGLGRWTEVSRGFLVEDTWPDSRVYGPHGFTPSSLP